MRLTEQSRANNAVASLLDCQGYCWSENPIKSIATCSLVQFGPSFIASRADILKSNMSSSQIDHAKVVADLFQDIITHTSYEKLKGISDQNAELHDKVEKLTTALDMNLENLHNTKAKLDKYCHELRKKDEQVQSLQKEADDLGSILAAKTHELDERGQTITRADDELRKAKLEILNLTERLEEERKKNEEKEAIEQELKLTREDLDQNKEELEILKNFSTPLKSMDAGNM